MLALIDYGYGNVRSVNQALSKVCSDEINLTNNPDDIFRADRIVLPGVGAFAQCIGALSAIDGMIEALNSKVLAQKAPFLGICVGMQLLADEGIEFESSRGLGWVKGVVNRIEPNDRALKIPHMGWNEALPQKQSFFESAWQSKPQDVYFVHSFAFRCENNEDIAASCQYGDDVFAAAVQKDNIFGVQFHPEKSQKAGLDLLKAWIKET